MNTQGKIASIREPYEVVINRGSNDFIDIGDIFRILSNKKEVIPDPDEPDGEPLGVLREAKLHVRVTEVRERMCVARTFREIRVLKDPSPLASVKVSIFNPPEYKWVRQTLQKRRSEDDDTGIAVGDEVERIEADEDDIARVAIFDE